VTAHSASGPVHTRVDLHLHSRASTDTGSWFVSRAGSPESQTEPAAAYASAKARGMDFVTLTDHNTIDGALEIAHHPDVLIGVEVTTRFPEDGVPLHVLVWGVDESRWADMDRLRGNLHELLAYLDAAHLPCALAHPLHRVGDRLTADHLERCLLLFGLWEGINGSRPRIGNEVAARLARSAHPDLLTRLAEKHGIPPRAGGRPALVGGSDDHGSFDIACAWTEMPVAGTPADVLEHLRAGRVCPGGANGSAEALAHSVGALATSALIERGILQVPGPMRAVLGDVLDRTIVPATATATATRPSDASVAAEVMAGVRRDRRLIRRYRRLAKAPDSRGRSHARIRLATGWIHQEMARRVWAGARGSSGIGGRAEAAVGALLAAAPYLLASRYVTSEERFARSVDEAFFGPSSEPADPVRAMMLTDTFSQVNGVAGTMRRLAAHIDARPSCGLRVITCEGTGDAPPGRVDLAPLARLTIPGYDDRALRPGVPSLIDLLDAVRGAEADVVHAATPGPMGIAGLAIARALGVPFVATYHTEFARYAHEITGDRLAGELVGRAMAWFYSQAERVYVPSATVADELVRGGLPESRLVRFGRGVDLDLFGPDRETRRMRMRMRSGRRTVVLYVGRLSREKGLDVIAEAMRRASSARGDLELCVVGEGPARAEFAAHLRGVRHRFLGALSGADLAAAYAGSDIFLFPSATETYGQVVVEAAASGLPRIVSDRGAARDHVRHADTGLVVPAGDAAAFARAVLLLADDRRLRHDIGRRALEDARELPGWPAVFDGLIASYRVAASPEGGHAMSGRVAA
jgi:glycosyltransferase involved in cell wall biosynthesis/predicted metal-dependent phosphoesterase TrpH